MKSSPLLPCSWIDFNQLPVYLWSFAPCDTSDQEHGAGSCKDYDCSFRRISSLRTFFDFYKRACALYNGQPQVGTERALQSHHDLSELIKLLRDNANLTRREFTQKWVADHTTVTSSTSIPDGNPAIDLAVRIMTMINTQFQNPFSDTIEQNGLYHAWDDGVCFRDFVRTAFPIRLQPLLAAEDDDGGDTSILWSLTASRLVKRAKLKFKPTDDITRHLFFDRKMRVVEIFHHVAFLKEHLRLSRALPEKETSTGQNQSEIIPRQIALEILDSIQKILFRHSSPASRALLRYLVSRKGFDPECLNFEASALRSLEENDMEYVHFGARMADLCAEIEHPAPNGWVERWMERRKGGRYVMMATLIGVLFAVLLGLLGLIVSVFQAWVSYQAWKHPVQQ